MVRQLRDPPGVAVHLVQRGVSKNEIVIPCRARIELRLPLRHVIKGAGDAAVVILRDLFQQILPGEGFCIHIFVPALPRFRMDAPFRKDRVLRRLHQGTDLFDPLRSGIFGKIDQVIIAPVRDEAGLAFRIDRQLPAILQLPLDEKAVSDLHPVLPGLHLFAEQIAALIFAVAIKIHGLLLRRKSQPRSVGQPQGDAVADAGLVETIG